MAANPYDILAERGFVAQVTDAEAVRALFAAGPVTVYTGYDPTAPSLHVGNLLTLMALKHLERAGHRPLVVLGGGTAMVGDPSGKTEMRQLLDGDKIRENLAAQRVQIAHLLDVAGGGALVVDNAEWLLELKYVDFLREIGRHFSVNRMLSAEAYKLRLERGLLFIEFNYQLLQAYDFLQLRRRFDCRLQAGGDDQWGNILAGVDLCRRVDGELVHGLTFPLLLTATGEKMGKTAAGAVWLDGARLSPFDYYQFWVNTHDDDVLRMLGYYTFLPMDQVRAVAKVEGEELNAAKSILAFEATALLHGREAALAARAAAQGAFGGRSIPAGLLPASTIPREASADAQQIPTTQLTPAELREGLTLVDVLVRIELADSKNAARRLITQGAVRINDAPASGVEQRLTVGDLGGEGLLIRAGKKKVHRVVCNADG